MHTSSHGGFSSRNLDHSSTLSRRLFGKGSTDTDVFSLQRLPTPRSHRRLAWCLSPGCPMLTHLGLKESPGRGGIRRSHFPRLECGCPLIQEQEMALFSPAQWTVVSSVHAMWTCGKRGTASVSGNLKVRPLRHLCQKRRPKAGMVFQLFSKPNLI